MYDVLTPDGHSIRYNEFFNSIESAKKAFDKWKIQWKQLGHYTISLNSKSVKIPYKDISRHCKLVKIEHTFIRTMGV